MITLDDAWNSQDWDTFKKRHSEDTAVYWPGQPEPTRGRKAHHEEAIEFFKTFPDNHVENIPYKALFGQGDWTCSVATFTGPMKGADGKEIPPTNKKFKVEFIGHRLRLEMSFLLLILYNLNILNSQNGISVTHYS